MSFAPDFLESECENRQAATARFHVIPVPLETSVSYGGGTAKGPFAILEASQQLEAWDGRSTPLVLGIHTTTAVDCSKETGQVLDSIQARVEKTLAMGAVPVVLGGEHTVTLGALRALKASYSQPFGIIQLDAHADLRDEYQGDCYSHACVMRRALEELAAPVCQIGVRTLSFEEQQVRDREGIRCLDAVTLYENGIPDMVLPKGFPDLVYLTLDVDGFDPSVIRATGTPVPGGVGWFEALALLGKCICGRKVIGFDVVELSPLPGDLASDFAAARLVYEIMGLIQRIGAN